MEDKKDILIDALEKLRQQEIAKNETWKARAYLNVIKQLKTTENPIYTFDDLKHVKGIGKGLKPKIEELISSGHISQLENYNSTGTIAAVNELLQVHGIGPVKAKDLVEKHGIMKVEDLNDHLDLLNEKQKLGLKYYRDIQERIPRKEMNKHNDLIMSVIKSVDPKLTAILTGSYRRNLKDSGDIDVLLTHEDDPSNIDTLLDSIVDKMKRTGYIKDILALGGKKCMAVCKLKRHRKHRRLDLLYTRQHEYPFALLYFTGSSEFNTDMRNYALKQGYSLSEYGIKYNSGDKAGEFVDYQFSDESSVFTFLSIPFVEPEKRKKLITVK